MKNRFREIQSAAAAGLLVCAVSTLSVGCSHSVHELAEFEALKARSEAASDAGNAQKASTLAEQAYDYAGEHFGPDDRKTITALNSLAQAKLDSEDLDEAEALASRAVDLGHSTYGYRDSLTLYSRELLSMVYLAQGRDQTAKTTLRRVMADRKNVRNN